MEIRQVERDPSAFQQPVDEQELRDQLGRELSGERVLEVTELDSGLFNNTYRVNTTKDAYILKVAPVAEAAVFFNERDLMQRESTLSRQLQSLSPLIPEYLSFFTLDGRDASLQAFIHGRLWHDVTASLTEAENTELWGQMGAFARIVNNCRGEAFGYPAPAEGFQQWSRFIVYNVEGMVDDCRRLGVICDEVEAYCRLLPHFLPALDQVKTARLVHGDLWPRNVIIDGAGADIHLKAVIDGERAFWGDPVSDWVMLFLEVPEAFWRAYGENLLETSDPACMAIYKGMYFILGILEAVRFQTTDEAPKKALSAINEELKTFLQARQAT